MMIYMGKLMSYKLLHKLINKLLQFFTEQQKGKNKTSIDSREV